MKMWVSMEIDRRRSEEEENDKEEIDSSSEEENVRVHDVWFVSF